MIPIFELENFDGKKYEVYYYPKDTNGSADPEVTELDFTMLAVPSEKGVYNNRK